VDVLLSEPNTDTIASFGSYLAFTSMNVVDDDVVDGNNQQLLLFLAIH
jgi:hypothetical protein